MAGKVDLRTNEWREAIIEIARAVRDMHLTNRALALMITDTANGVSLTQALKVIGAIEVLDKKYLKET